LNELKQAVKTDADPVRTGHHDEPRISRHPGFISGSVIPKHATNIINQLNNYRTQVNMLQ
jgi:hypothetical protein